VSCFALNASVERARERGAERYSSDIATIVDIEKLALTLPEKERATLAANLLESLPGVLSDEDAGIAEALRRNAELEANPDRAVSLAQLDAQIKSRRV
jgi:putative addiction module component (TIGR02574 family)